MADEELDSPVAEKDTTTLPGSQDPILRDVGEGVAIGIAGAVAGLLGATVVGSAPTAGFVAGSLAGSALAGSALGGKGVDAMLAGLGGGAASVMVQSVTKSRGLGAIGYVLVAGALFKR